MAGGKRGKADTARHREQRAAAFSVRSGTAVRRPLRPAEAAALVEGIDRSKHGLQKYGIRQLCKLELNRTLGEIAPEGGGVEEPAAQLDARARKEIRDNRAGWIGWLGEHGLAESGYDPARHSPVSRAAFFRSVGGAEWRDSLTLLEYSSWRGKDVITCGLLRGGADPHPAGGDGGAARAALCALPDDGAVWLLRAVVRLRFAAVAAAAVADGTAAAARCEGCGNGGSAASLGRWPCGHSRCSRCIWRGVSSRDPDAVMLRCLHCSQVSCGSITSAAEALAAIDELLLSSDRGEEDLDRSLCFPALRSGEDAEIVRRGALERGLVVGRAPGSGGGRQQQPEQQRPEQQQPEPEPQQPEQQPEREGNLVVGTDRSPFRAGVTDVASHESRTVHPQRQQPPPDLPQDEQQDGDQPFCFEFSIENEERMENFP